MIGLNKSIVVERLLTQDEFDRFASLSGDNNPIHVDADFSAATRFGRTVAHGSFLNSILRGLLETLVPGGRQTSQELIFPAPTYADEPMRFVAEISSESEQTVEVAMVLTRIVDDVVTCQGSTTIHKGAV